jgi:hypothetical protein
LEHAGQPGTRVLEVVRLVHHEQRRTPPGLGEQLAPQVFLDGTQGVTGDAHPRGHALAVVRHADRHVLERVGKWSQLHSLQCACHRLGDRVVAQPSVLVAYGLVEGVFPRLGIGLEKPPPQILSPVMGPLFTHRPQELRQEPVDLALDLDETVRLAPSVTPESLRDQRKADPFVGLAAAHGTLRQEDHLAAFARGVVEEPHEFDAVAGHTVANAVRIPRALIS